MFLAIFISLLLLAMLTFSVLGLIYLWLARPDQGRTRALPRTAKRYGDE